MRAISTLKLARVVQVVWPSLCITCTAASPPPPGPARFRGAGWPEVVTNQPSQGWAGTFAPVMNCPVSSKCDLSTCYVGARTLVTVCGWTMCCACTLCRQGRVAQWTTPAGVKLESLYTQALSPPFAYAYNPFDKDMLNVRRTLMVEPLLTAQWIRQTQTCCSRGGLVLDVGANFGWYTLLSRALGCATMSFEPVSAFRDVLHLGLYLNKDFKVNATVFPNAVFDIKGNYTMVVPVSGPARKPNNSIVPHPTLRTHRRSHLGISVMLGPKGLAAVKDVTKQEPGTIVARESVATITLDGVVPPDSAVCALKVDVEGLEPSVLQTARRMLATQKVEALQLEITLKTAQACDTIRMLRDILLYGFDIYGIPHDAGCRTAETCSPKKWPKMLSRSALLASAQRVRFGKGLSRAAVNIRANRAARLASKVYERCTKIRGFSSNLLAIRGTYVPGELLPSFDNLGCPAPEETDDLKVPSQAGFYS
mmetsp:Transcript_45111/g.118305  ORF Transcript_45111/g.118305 Transcript_45111/m.118305 type:complete len:480 (+) Transcript_45111:165-1604(+)|eukprot:CAMPEP_0115841864 /NCGR_PEP_ID=MMETSP0287-20121206/7507_1 /TAXON_ID=412157 /ORGANISM="Chrysochromulina rotalis, Strain UIO044" /LENGTH=479 /DNA_ID=CAMNT_0003295521 /DNA_START=99 /DNA_END=1538 /DNA_ORIENTATION=+